MVSATMFAHEGASRILLTNNIITNIGRSADHLTSVDFPTGTELSRLVDISAIEGVALVGAHSPNL